jgi:hypothetical protein
MHSLIKEDELGLGLDALVTDHRSRSEQSTEELACKPLWLTSCEAEALVVLCVVSPAGCGDSEQELFRKLGAFVRLFS